MPCQPSNSAATVVALRMASMGDMPSRTSCSNSCAWLISVQGKPPASVPKAILTPALRQLASDFAWIFGSSPQIAQPSRARPGDVIGDGQGGGEEDPLLRHLGRGLRPDRIAMLDRVHARRDRDAHARVRPRVGRNLDAARVRLRDEST
ncbi:MAG: hypothetical protein AUI33_11225 [Ignavibacteria bacterium 13_1_40CM_2_61_4]|nr:MAG: hypothetical protein AUI33_11225 [Ignavibacteria bacterium 13_1_40CM_2_61_4]